MDDTLALNEVRSALNALHSAHATSDTIHASERVLDAFKTSLEPAAAVAHAHTLLSPILNRTSSALSSPEILFAFHLLEQRVLNNGAWLSHPNELRKMVRSLAVTLVANSSNNFPHFVAEKARALLIALAVREWPQHWPTFMDDVLSAQLPKSTVCALLRILSEEVHEFSDCIETSRRTELAHAMALVLPNMLSYITDAANVFATSAQYDGLRAALAAIEALLSWAPLPVVFEAHVPEACITLLKNEHIADAALSALRVLVKRKESGKSTHDSQDGSEFAHAAAFRQIVFPALVQFVANTEAISIVAMSYVPPMGALPNAVEAFRTCTYAQRPLHVDGERHEFYVSFIRMMASLGSTHFLPSFLPVVDTDEAAGRTAAAFIDIMVAACASPSIAMRMAAVPFFCAVFTPFVRTLEKLPSATRADLADKAAFANSIPSSTRSLVITLTNPLAQELLFTIVIRYVNAASIMMVPWPSDKLAAAYAEEDFAADPAQVAEQLLALKARTVTHIGFASRLQPDVTARVAVDRLIDLLTKANTLASQSREHANGSGAVQQQEGFTGNGGVIHPGAVATDGDVNGKPPYTLGLVKEHDSQQGWVFGEFNIQRPRDVEAALEAAIASTEAVLAGVTASKFFNRNVSGRTLVEKLFQVVMGLSHKQLDEAKVTALRMFIPMYTTSDSALHACLKCLVDVISKSADKSTVRFRACQSLATICRRLGKSRAHGLQRFREDLCRFAIMAHSSNNFSIAERSSLLEAAIAVALSIENFDERAGIIETLINPLLLSLDTTGLTGAVNSPNDLYTYIDTSKEKQHAFSAIHILESAVHQVVRAQRHSAAPLKLPIALSRSIAPKTVAFGAALVTALHGMYNPAEFGLAGKEEKRTSVLLPTSREIAYLLNLDGSSSVAAWSAPAAGSFSEDQDENTAKSAIERSDDVLARFGITPPDQRYRRDREMLKNLRSAGYELLRGAILSGVTQSQDHLQLLLKAVCANCQCLEPIHMYYLLNKVIRHLLSFQTTSADKAFLTIVSESELPTLLGVARENIESCTTRDTVSSDIPTLDVARDHARKMVARAAADMLSAMFPKEGKGIAVHNESDTATSGEYLPPPLEARRLAESLVSLWDATCSPAPGVADNGAARVALALLGRAVECAPANALSLYIGRLRVCLRTAVQSDGMGSDSPMEAAIGAILTFFKKWPEAGEKTVCNMLNTADVDLMNTVRTSLKEVMQLDAGKSRKFARAKIRSMVGVIAQRSGVSVRKQATVRALNEKLVTRNPARDAKREKSKLEDIQLGDQALDSLFGDGAPL